MKQINSYLTFNGNCREAMTFYQYCLEGTDLVFQTIGESPAAVTMPEEMKDYILHAVLRKGPVSLMGTDMVAGDRLVKGNAVSIMLNCSSEAEIRMVYARLSEGGRATHPLQVSFWGSLFGDLTDKYGNNWLLNFEYQEARI